MGHNLVHSAGQAPDQTPIDQGSMSSLVASRICHDLVSPMGAISNGLELLAMARDQQGPELELIAQSIHCANTRLRLYRIAFGAVSSNQCIAQTEILSVLADLGKLNKHSYAWRSQAELTRRQVKLIFLLILCLETALPWGGRIEVHDTAQGVALCGVSDRLKIDDTLWIGLVDGTFCRPITSAQVQFLLARDEICAQSAKLRMQEDGCQITIDLGL